MIRARRFSPVFFIVLATASSLGTISAQAQALPKLPLPSLPTLPNPAGLIGGINLTNPGALTVGCPYKVNTSQGKNTGFLDTNAFYAIAEIPLSLPDGASIRVDGQFQPVRYFSLQSYDGSKSGNFIDTLPDAHIVPGDGTTPDPNISLIPFADSTGASYEVHLRYASPPSNPADREPNVLYVGPASTNVSPTRVAKQVVYRIYLANPGIDPNALPLPQLIYSGANGDIPLSDTPDKNRCAEIAALSSVSQSPNPAIFPSRDIRFQPIAGAKSQVLFPNGDANYLRAAFSLEYGALVVVRSMRMPTPSQTLVENRVRYWSLCHYALSTGAVYSCSADGETVTQSDGYDNFVISTAANRPAFAYPAYGYNWIESGSARSELIVLRQLLATPDFPGNYAKSVAAPSSTVGDVLGVWAPQISYCDATTFSSVAGSGGAALISACVAASPKPLLPSVF
jgi:hypothetical protein